MHHIPSSVPALIHMFCISDSNRKPQVRVRPYRPPADISLSQPDGKGGGLLSNLKIVNSLLPVFLLRQVCEITIE